MLATMAARDTYSPIHSNVFYLKYVLEKKQTDKNIYATIYGRCDVVTESTVTY